MALFSRELQRRLQKPDKADSTQWECLPIALQRASVSEQFLIRRSLREKRGNRRNVHHYLDRFVGWKAGSPVYLAMVAVPIVFGFRSADTGFVGLALGLLIYLFVWQVTRKRGAQFAQQQAIGSKVM